MKNLSTIKSQTTLRPPTVSAYFSPQNRPTKQDKERSMQIKQENNVLLKKLLRIDAQHFSLTPSHKKSVNTLPSLKSLRFWKRCEEHRMIGQGNSLIMKKLATVHSAYSSEKYKRDFQRHKALSNMLSKHSGRYIKNPYFLHSQDLSKERDRTEFLIRKILSRRSQRLLGSEPKPQTAIGSMRSSAENFMQRPGTSETCIEGADFSKIIKKWTSLHSESHLRPKYSLVSKVILE